jgi:uncharacterized protein (TIGR03437 family)
VGCASAQAQPAPPQALTAIPQGPIHVERNRLVDRERRAFLIRGAGLPQFRTHAPARSSVAVGEFGPHSATVLNTVRQRWNMNAVRLPLSLSDFESDPRYLEAVAEVVRRANDLELLAILAVDEPDAALPAETLIGFWRAAAAFFRDYPQLVFELDAGSGAGAQALVQAVRAGGAKQPVAIGEWPENPVHDKNAIYMLHPRYTTTRTGQDRDREIGRIAETAPVLASDLDPELDRDSEECHSLPSDPSEAEALVQANLDYFDAHGISWVASQFRPGKLITDYRHMYPTTLENGWTCGPQERAGIGEMIQFHLWGGELRGLFAVNEAGNFMLPRGGIAIIYGGIFADRDTRSTRNPPPEELAGVSVAITDRTGVARRAGLTYVSAGWGQANIVVPAGCAVGPARVSVSRRDGTSASTPIGIVDVAPGLWTGTADGRGPVSGFAVREMPGQKFTSVPILRCDSGNCSTIPIPVSARGFTTVRLLGSGFRYAAGLARVQVKIGGSRVPVVAFGPSGGAGEDQLTLRIPPSLRGVGETDLVCSIDGHLSNVVRIDIGSAGRSR